MKTNAERRMKGQRGNALVISMLTMLTMTSVGVVSIRLTNTDLMVAGNLVRSGQATQAAEAGLLLQMAKQEDRPHMPNNRIKSQRKGGSLSFGPDGEIITGSKEFINYTEAYSTEDPDPANSADKTEDLPVVDPANLDSSVALMRQRMAFRTGVRYSGEVQEIPGNSLDGEVCYSVIDLQSTGAIPTVEKEKFQDTADNSASSPVEYRARTLVGPTRCNT